MKIGCPFCGKKYKIDSTRIERARVRVKCKACGHFITVEKPAAAPGKNDAMDLSPPAVGTARETPGKEESPAPDRETPVTANESPFPKDERPPTPSLEETWDAEDDESLLSTITTEARPAADEPPAPQDEEPDLESALRDETAETDLTPKSEKVALFNRIQFRLGAILLTLAIIISAAFIAHTHITENARISRDLKLAARIAASRLAMHLEHPLLSRDMEKVGDSIATEMLDKNIHAILVRSPDGKTVLSGRQRNSAWKAMPASGNIRGNTIHSRKDVYDRNRNEKIGSVEVHLTPKFLKGILNELILNILIMTVIWIAAICIALTLGVRKMILRPVMELIRAADTMALGDLRVDIDVGPKNEIGVLARAIERMRGSLRAALKRMRRKI